MKKITVLGSLNADTILHIPHLPQQGETMAMDDASTAPGGKGANPVSYTHLRAHETDSYLVCRLLLEKKKKIQKQTTKKKKNKKIKKSQRRNTS